MPIIAEVDGFVRVQNTDLDAREKTLVILYYKQPTKVSDAQLAKWIKYKNPSRFKTAILPKLDEEVLIHYEAGFCTLTPKGARFVENDISLELFV